jgi:hypothetical protein
MVSLTSQQGQIIQVKSCSRCFWLS